MTVLLLHGLGATGRVWDGFRSLNDGSLAPDLPGHGTAARLPEYTFSSMAAAVAEELQGSSDLTVVGHSLGGVIALELASGRYGVQVATVIALGVKVVWSDDELARAGALAQRPITWFDTRDEAAARYLKVSGLQGLVDPSDDSVDHGLQHEGGRWRLALDPKAFGVGAPDMPELLRAGQASVVLARGELDPMNTDAQLTALHDKVITLPGLGHNAHVEDPAALSIR
ncbi:pimeloyl-ACP methyl ester carboxylesterase [Kribbella voronezhensis]|uniref:Pimeloyl-ACP methyl ester carboxylesterase n=1 Tax=Kribbella voronezhensis TaxID=2512212 RepID=A0A4R7TE96_9ACTN|nr:alpha/beta hydrolase [Kribbella voronezhensis]TDU90455.1 pimeloyl-ACP methyl ester carboxylesterase [Kribbella voronezhensis]